MTWIVTSVCAKFQVQILCCLPEVSKCIRAELYCLLVKGLISTDSKTHVRYLFYSFPFNAACLKLYLWICFWFWCEIWWTVSSPTATQQQIVKNYAVRTRVQHTNKWDESRFLLNISLLGAEWSHRPGQSQILREMLEVAQQVRAVDRHRTQDRRCGFQSGVQQVLFAPLFLASVWGLSV